jgi:CRP-like cAMP-binding protein
MTSNLTAEVLDLENLGSASGFVEEIVRVVEKLSLFEGFTRPEYRNLCEYMECLGARKDVTILREGAYSDFLLIILTGQVNVIKDSPSYGKKLVAQVGPGAILGELSLMDGQPRFASCVTTQPTDFVVLRRCSLNTILHQQPQLGAKVLLLLLQLMTRRLRNATTRMLPTIIGESI